MPEWGRVAVTVCDPSCMVEEKEQTEGYIQCRQIKSITVTDVQSTQSLTIFRQRLKTHLFRRSYPDLII